MKTDEEFLTEVSMREITCPVYGRRGVLNQSTDATLISYDQRDTIEGHTHETTSELITCVSIEYFARFKREAERAGCKEGKLKGDSHQPSYMVCVQNGRALFGFVEAVVRAESLFKASFTDVLRLIDASIEARRDTLLAGMWWRSPYPDSVIHGVRKMAVPTEMPHL